jgi:uncharacterized protein (DUF58 family)
VVAGLHHGSRRSLRLGQDVEFADYKPYILGDNPKDLDWKVYGRSDRLVVRRHQAETEMSATILLDASGDLGSTPEKMEQARVLAAALAWFLHTEREPVGLAIGAGEGSLQWLPPRSSPTHVARVLSTIATVQPSGRVGLESWLRDLGERLRPRSLLLLLSDFAEEPAAWTPSLDALTRRRVDFRAFHLYDQREVDLSFERPLQLYSLEAGDRRPIDPVAMREAFRTEAGRFFREVESAVQARRGHCYRVEARADLVPILSRFIRGSV